MDKMQISKEICSAIKGGNLVVELIDGNVEVLNMITPFGTWLHVAASKGYIEIVRYLVSCGAELDISDPIRNPLFGAISNGYPGYCRTFNRKWYRCEC